MSSEITPGSLKIGPFVNDGHTDFGGIHVTILRHTKFPRLIALDRPFDKNTREKTADSIVREWLVDGQPAANLEEAARRLMIPPTLTDEEIFVLARTPNDWIELAELAKIFIGLDNFKLGPILTRLNLKGLIESQLKTTLIRSISSIRRTPATFSD